MLQRLRSSLQGIIARFIIALITVPFVLWGVDAFFLDSGNPDVAEVNGKAITEQELSQQVYRQRQQMLARMGDQVDASQVDEAMLRGPVLEQLVQQRLMEATAEERGLVISDAMVDQVILQQTDFQEDGVFSPQRFDVLVRGNGMTPTQYKQSIKRQLLINQLMSGLVASEFVTPAELELSASITGQKRDIEYALLELGEVRETMTLDEDEVQSYYDSHPQEFVTPEQVAVEFIELKLEDYYPELEEEEVRAVYEGEVAEMDLGSRRRAAHILIETSDEQDAAAVQQQLSDVRARILAGEDFAAIAKQLSQDIGSREMGGDLGYTDGSAFPEAFEEALTTLEVGEISEPVETEAGWHLVKLTEIEQADVPSFDERRAAIAQRLQEAKAEPQYAVKLEELKDISFNAADLASVAEQLQLKTQTSGLFSREGDEAGLFADNRLLVEAFSSTVLEQGANSEVVELSPSHAVVVRLAQRQPSQPVPFAEVESELSSRLIDQKTTAYMEQRANDILTAIEGGQQLKAMAESESLDYQRIADASRENIGDMPMEIAAAAFQLNPPVAGEARYTTQTLNDGNVVIIALNRVELGSLADLDDASRQNMRRILDRYRSERLVQAYRTSLQSSADIEML